jgi:glycosyltransferase involved in cell wall biosynthesis
VACYRQRATQTVSYKLFDYLGAGLPIISSLDGEMADILEREGIGWNYPPEDARALGALVQTILDHRATVSSMARRARAFAESHGNAETVYPAMAAFIDGTAASA